MKNNHLTSQDFQKSDAVEKIYNPSLMKSDHVKHKYLRKEGKSYIYEDEKTGKSYSSDVPLHDTKPINNVEFINSEIENRTKRINDIFQQQKAKIENLNNNMNMKINLFKQKSHELHQVLFENGLNINSISMSKTGFDSDDWKEGDKLHISMTLIPFNNKIKFLKFSGYTSSGRGKNQERLNEKAKNLSESIRNATGLHTSVNQFSLEVKDENDTKRILAEIWV